MYYPIMYYPISYEGKLYRVDSFFTLPAFSNDEPSAMDNEGSLWLVNQSLYEVEVHLFSIIAWCLIATHIQI